MSSAKSIWKCPPLRPVLALGLLALACPASAAENGPRDCVLTVRVRQVLIQEPALAPLNLGVSVRQGVATLYGSVPSAALAKLAREKVARVQGVLEVRSELEVRPSDDPLSEFLNLLPNALAPLPDFLSHERYPPPGWLTSRWSDGETVPSIGKTPAVSLMPPVTLQTPTAAAEKTDLARSVEQLRQQDVRFHRLRATVQDGIVRLSGSAPHSEDVMMFARQISRLPGVGRVIIQEVRTTNDP